MPDGRCAAVRYWLGHSTLPPHPPATITCHVAECPTCRGALATLTASLAPMNPDLAEVPCDMCQLDLAVYIEYEEQYGSSAAIRRYPQIWWHLTTCSECNETYELIRGLVEAEGQGCLKLPAPHPPPLPAIHLPRLFLHTVFAPQLALGDAWGNEGDEALVAEETHTNYQIAIAVQTSYGPTWGVTVRVIPPIAGQAVVSFGGTSYRATFDHLGRALIEPIPATLLAGADGPDMVVSVEAVEGRQTEDGSR